MSAVSYSVVGPVTKKITRPINKHPSNPGRGASATGIVAYEEVVVTIASGQTVGTANMAVCTDETACVPFASWYGASGVSTFDQNPGAFQCEVQLYDNAGTPAVRCTRYTVATGFALTVRVGILQFDTSKVRVRQLTTSSSAVDVDFAVSPAADLSKTFAVFYAFNMDDGSGLRSYNMWGRFTSTTNFRVSRGTSASTAFSRTYRVYVLEDIHGSMFDVYTHNFTVARNYTTAGTATTDVSARQGSIASMTSTFGSGRSNTNTSSNEYGRQIFGSDSTNVIVAHAYLNSALTQELTVFEVEWLNGSGVKSSRKTWQGAGSPNSNADVALTITAINTSKAISLPSSYGRMGQMLSQSNANNSRPRMASQLQKTSSTSMTMKGSVGVGVANYASWCFVQALEMKH